MHPKEPFVPWPPPNPPPPRQKEISPGWQVSPNSPPNPPENPGTLLESCPKPPLSLSGRDLIAFSYCRERSQKHTTQGCGPRTLCSLEELTVFSTKLSTFVLVCGRMLSEVGQCLSPEFLRWEPNLTELRSTRDGR